MTCKCKECGRKYTYDDEVGYSRDICGPYCDGRHSQVAEISRLRALLGELDKRLLRAADVLVFGLAAGGTEEKRPDAECEANQDLIASTATSPPAWPRGHSR